MTKMAMPRDVAGLMMFSLCRLYESLVNTEHFKRPIYFIIIN